MKNANNRRLPFGRILNFVDKIGCGFSNFFAKRRGCGQIAMFHDIYEDAQPHDQYSCSLSAFISYIGYCQKNGYRFVSIDDLISKGNDGKWQICLTFDDGFASVAGNVSAFLSKNRIPFVVFLTASFIGSDGYLSFDDVVKLSKNEFCTLGYHGYEHKMFRFETDANFTSDFSKSVSFFDTKFGLHFCHFAFPYGSRYAVSFSKIRIAKKFFNLKSVCLTTPMFVTKRKLKAAHSLPRFNLPYFINTNQLGRIYICRR